MAYDENFGKCSWCGLDDCNNCEEIAPPSPRCHMTPMIFHMGEDESWWECDHCGHEKDV